MPDENDKPTRPPETEPQQQPERPRVPIPAQPRPELIDIQTEGYDPKYEKKKR